LKFNDGQPVPDALISQTLLELEQRFGAISWGTQIIRGRWREGGVPYENELFRVFVDVEGVPNHRELFRGYTEQLKVRFRQLEIYTVTYRLDAI
jgi:hypothetical protein